MWYAILNTYVVCALLAFLGIAWQVFEAKIWYRQNNLKVTHPRTFLGRCSSWCKLIVMSLIPLYNLLVIISTFWYVFSDKRKEEDTDRLLEQGYLTEKE